VPSTIAAATKYAAPGILFPPVVDHAYTFPYRSGAAATHNARQFAKHPWNSPRPMPHLVARSVAIELVEALRSILGHSTASPDGKQVQRMAVHEKQHWKGPRSILH
jgi:hypothetical protein